MLTHVTISSWGRTTLFPRSLPRRAFLRGLAKTRPELVLFCLADDHLHLVLESDRPTVAAGYVLRMLRSTVQGRIGPPRLQPVGGRRHLERLVSYLLDQPLPHGVDTHPGLWEGGAFVDLVGARLLPGFDHTRLWRFRATTSDGSSSRRVSVRSPRSRSDASTPPRSGAQRWEPTPPTPPAVADPPSVPAPRRHTSAATSPRPSSPR